jgi:hypothetical protein
MLVLRCVLGEKTRGKFGRCAYGDVNNRQASDPGQCVNGNSYVSRLLYCAGNTSADWSNERLTVLEDLANLTSYGAGLPSSRRRHPLRFARRCGPSTSLAVSLPTHASPARRSPIPSRSASRPYSRGPRASTRVALHVTKDAGEGANQLGRLTELAIVGSGSPRVLPQSFRGV